MLNYVGFNFSGWWLNQPIWKICSSNWIISPRIGVKIKEMFETTNQFSTWRYLNVTFYFTSGWLYSTATHPDYSIFEGNVSANITQKTPPVGNLHSLAFLTQSCYHSHDLSSRNSSFNTQPSKPDCFFVGGWHRPIWTYFSQNGFIFPNFSG